MTDGARTSSIDAPFGTDAVLRVLMDGAPLGIATFDRELRYVSINETLAVLNGISASDHVGRPITEVLPAGPGRDQIVDCLRRALASGEPLRDVAFAWTPGAPNGSERRASASFFPIREGTAVVGVASVVTDTSALAAAQRRLEDREALFRVVQEVSPFGFVHLRPVRDASGALVDFEYVYQNETAARINELPRGDAVLGTRLRESVPQFAPQRLWDAYVRVLETGQPWQDEQLFVTDAGRGWFDMTVVAVADGLAVTFEDVTARKMAELSVLAERESLRTVIAQSPVSMAAFRGPAHVLEVANGRYEEMVGRALTAGRTLRELFPDLAGDGVLERFDEVFRSGRPFSAEAYRVRIDRTGDGTLEERIYAFDVVPRLDADKHPTGVLLVAVDVTEHVASRERVERLQRVTAALSGAGTPAEVAEVAAKLTVEAVGARGGLVGVIRPAADILDVLSLVGYDEIAEAWRTMPLDAESPVIDSARDGQTRFLDDRAALFAAYPGLREVLHPADEALATVPLTASGRTLGALGLSFATPRTFTEAEREHVLAIATQCALALDRAHLYAAEAEARDRAESANRAKDDFVAMVSHELRTPLNAVTGWVQMLRTGRLDGESGARALESIARNAGALARLIDDLLDISRIASGKFRLELGDVDVAQVALAAVEGVRPAAAARDIQLEVIVAPEVATFRADAARLQQVLWNLLTNAIKFTPRGGEVRFSVERDGRDLAFTVTDTGKGIPPEFLPHVFEAFRQADGSLTRSHGGLGLGLSISRSLVELQGGTIEARSAGKDQGATFVVRLPGQDTAFAPPPVRSSGLPRGDVRLDGVRVLVVDDDADARELVSAALASFGADVETAAGSAEALAVLVRRRPDVLVSDIGMPGEDGYALLRKVKDLPAERGRVPAIALTAHGRPEDRSRSEGAGFAAHLQKPVDVGELARCVRELATPA